MEAAAVTSRRGGDDAAENKEKQGLQLFIYTKGESKFSKCQRLPESQKSSTRGIQSSPSVALGEELHSGKRGFSECRSLHGTRGRMTLRKSALPRAQHSGKTSTRGRKVFLDVPNKRRRWSLK